MKIGKGGHDTRNEGALEHACVQAGRGESVRALWIIEKGFHDSGFWLIMSPIMKKQAAHIDGALGDAPDDVFESIHAIMHLHRSRQYRELRDSAQVLTHMENKVLGFFARSPGATQSDLVAHSGRDKAQLARLIRGLRDKGLLEAQVDEADRRSTRLKLTSEGHAVHKALHRRGARLSRIAVAGLSDEECRILVSLLHRVRSNLAAEPE